MEQTYFISVEDCCQHYNIEIEFIDSLEAHGLLVPILQNEHRYLEHDHLQQLEKLINMHYEMDINLEGMEVISRLLDRIESMQEEINSLRRIVG